MRNGKWTHSIRCYRAPNQGGGLYSDVSVSSPIALAAELAAVRTLIRKGIISDAKLIYHVEPYGIENIWP